jgi:hypothetical protein
MVRGRLINFASLGTVAAVESSMLLRVAIVCACVFGASAAVAEELGPEQAKAFVVGKLFAYTCFDGTAGIGRIFADGSVVGTIRPGGKGEAHFAALPAGTVKVEHASMCAHLAGMPIEPCFKVQKINYRSFRGSIAGLGFAYCDFRQHNPRTQLTRNAHGAEPMRVEAVRAAPVTPVHATPLTSLRPAIEE